MISITPAPHYVMLIKMNENDILNKANTINLPRDAAGRRITASVPRIRPGETIRDAKELIEKNAKKYESINYIYVTSKSGRLKGVVSIKDIFNYPPDTRISEIMVTKVVKAKPETDQEKVALKALRNNIKSIPIVNDQGRFLGALTNDSILNILDTEYREDFLKMSGIVITKNSHLNESMDVFKSFKVRAPWILIGLFGGLFTAKLIGLFDRVLEEEIVFASFIPLVAYITNAVGTQTQTLYIRDMSQNTKIPFLRYSAKQLLITSLIALTSWGAIIAVARLFWNSIFLGIVIGIAVFTAIIVATIFSILVPYILDKAKVDPAAGSGPFTTIIQDLLSVLIYLGIVSVAVNAF